MSNQPDRFRGTPDPSIVVRNEHTGWWYSRWIGVMYGKVPVGIIVVGGGLIIWALTH